VYYLAEFPLFWIFALSGLIFHLKYLLNERSDMNCLLGPCLQSAETLMKPTSRSACFLFYGRTGLTMQPSPKSTKSTGERFNGSLQRKKYAKILQVLCRMGKMETGKIGHQRMPKSDI
jgi:hypothetical protein